MKDIAIKQTSLNYFFKKDARLSDKPYKKKQEQLAVEKRDRLVVRLGSIKASGSN